MNIELLYLLKKLNGVIRKKKIGSWEFSLIDNKLDIRIVFDFKVLLDQLNKWNDLNISSLDCLLKNNSFQGDLIGRKTFDNGEKRDR